MKNQARGATMVEFLVVVPALLLMGLGIVQTVLVFHGKNALNYAFQEAARMGAVNHASLDKVETGLKNGLIPFMGGGRNLTEIATTRAKIEAEFAEGKALGWIHLQQLSPTTQSFADWEENGFDESGNAVTEIPNANLPILRCTADPKSGVTGTRTSTACPSGGEKVGTSSQQTLADANLLKLQLTYGVKLSVPIISRIVGGALSMIAGCSTPADQQLGPLNLGTPTVSTDPAACAYYQARDLNGNPAPRIPVNLAVTVRMQSTARRAGDAGWFMVASRGTNANTGGVQLGNGTVDAASGFLPIPVAQLNPSGVTAANDTMAGTGAGSTYIGSSDALPPVTCTGH